jgi:hypothetical protein
MHYAMQGVWLKFSYLFYNDQMIMLKLYCEGSTRTMICEPFPQSFTCFVSKEMFVMNHDM